MTVWFLVGNGGMDPYSSPYIIPNHSPHNPFPTKNQTDEVPQPRGPSHTPRLHFPTL